MTDDATFVNDPLRLTCADAIELMTDYLDDALSRRDLDNFEVHLGQCEGCRVYLDQLRRTITLTAETRDRTVELSPSNFDELAAALARQSQAP